jgi:hypothetical protein
MLPPDVITAVQDQLHELEVEDQTIKQIVDILESGAGELEHGRPGTLNAARLGGSARGAELGHHTSIAHQHVVKAMEQMVLGLNGYQANVQKFHKDIDFVDEDSHASSTRTTGKVNGVVPTVLQSDGCAAPDDFEDNNQCTIPGDGDN